MAVHAPETVCGVRLRQAIADHRIAKLIGDSDPRRARSKNYDSLVAQRGSAHSKRGYYSRQSDRTRALQVLVECADLVAELFENAPSIRRCKVFPLQQCVWEQFRHYFDVSLNKIVVTLPGDARMPVSDVQRVRQQTLAVCADVEHNRNRARGVNAAGGCVDRQFADGDFDTADAPVANPENVLSIGGEYKVDIIR